MRCLNFESQGGICLKTVAILLALFVVSSFSFYLGSGMASGTFGSKLAPPSRKGAVILDDEEAPQGPDPSFREIDIVHNLADGVDVDKTFQMTVDYDDIECSIEQVSRQLKLVATNTVEGTRAMDYDLQSKEAMSSQVLKS